MSRVKGGRAGKLCREREAVVCEGGPLKLLNVNVAKPEKLRDKGDSSKELQFNSDHSPPCLYYKMQTPQQGLRGLHD